MKDKILIALGLIALTLASCGVAGAQTVNEGVCQPQDQHIDGGNATEIDIEAPDGFLISGYCVKAGSINQELGPEYETFDPPIKRFYLRHSSGKEISHYVIFYVNAPDPTTTVSATTTVAVTTSYLNQPPTTPTWVPGEEPEGCGSACPEPDLPPPTVVTPGQPTQLPSTGVNPWLALAGAIGLFVGLGLLILGKDRTKE